MGQFLSFPNSMPPEFHKTSFISPEPDEIARLTPVPLQRTSRRKKTYSWEQPPLPSELMCSALIKAFFKGMYRYLLRRSNTVFSHALADTIPQEHKDCKKQTWSLYLLNARTICAIFLHNRAQCVHRFGKRSSNQKNVENAALFLRLGLPSILIRHENRALIFENALHNGKIWKRPLCILKTKFFENNDVKLITWFPWPNLPQTQIQNDWWL